MAVQNLVSKYTKRIPHLLAELNLSLVFSSYQMGKIIILSACDEKLIQLHKEVVGVKGIAIKDEQMALALGLGIQLFHNDSQLATSYPTKPNIYDALYLPTTLYRTDYLDTHDIAFTKQGPVGVNTAFNCLCTFDSHSSFKPFWRPEFIDTLTYGDRCHLNGLAVDANGAARYVTAFSQSNAKEGWRSEKGTQGILVDIKTHDIILDHLPMPHSPRIHENTLYMLLSGTGEVIRVDVTCKRYDVIASLNGFVRGLGIYGDYLFVGVSKFRDSHMFTDTQNTQEQVMPGIYVFHKNGQQVGEIVYDTELTEIYDVQVLPGKARVNLLGFNAANEYEYQAIMMPSESKWIKRGHQ